MSRLVRKMKKLTRSTAGSSLRNRRRNFWSHDGDPQTCSTRTRSRTTCTARPICWFAGTASPAGNGTLASYRKRPARSGFSEKWAVPSPRSLSWATALPAGCPSRVSETVTCAGIVPMARTSTSMGNGARRNANDPARTASTARSVRPCASPIPYTVSGPLRLTAPAPSPTAAPVESRFRSPPRSMPSLNTTMPPSRSPAYFRVMPSNAPPRSVSPS